MKHTKRKVKEPYKFTHEKVDEILLTLQINSRVAKYEPNKLLPYRERARKQICHIYMEDLAGLLGAWKNVKKRTKKTQK